jgi:hypothetical protein
MFRPKECCRRVLSEWSCFLVTVNCARSHGIKLAQEDVLPPRLTPQQLAPLLSSRSSSEVCQCVRRLHMARRLPSTISESVPRVNEALRPTAIVGGMLVVSGCDNGALARDGSLNGSSSPSEFMVTSALESGDARDCTLRIHN